MLPVWIGVAMAAGLLMGRLVPGLGSALSAVEVDGISLPIAIGLLVMMYPVLAMVRYDQLGEVTGDRKLMVSSLALNWLVGPAVMFALAWLLLADLPDYRTRRSDQPPSRSRPWPNSASTSPPPLRRSSPPTRCNPATSSSLWAAVTPARTFPSDTFGSNADQTRCTAGPLTTPASGEVLQAVC
jgi:Sodium Bile acid symporter family